MPGLEQQAEKPAVRQRLQRLNLALDGLKARAFAKAFAFEPSLAALRTFTQ